MIVITEKLGNIYSAFNPTREIDILLIEWHETRKRILHRQTNRGKAIAIKFLNQNPNLKDGDILYEDKNYVIAVEINPCECIVITPANTLQASSASYEIGNRHLPLFHEEDELLVPYDAPLHYLLQSLGYIIKVEKRKLNNCFQTTVLPHLQIGIADSFTGKINDLTTSS